MRHLPVKIGTDTFQIMTAPRAVRMGLAPSRKYGYIVSVTPKQKFHTGPHRTHGIAAWCKTKGIAEGYLADKKKYAQ